MYIHHNPIHHNPIHHKFRKTYGDWKFSSYLDFLSDTNTFIARENVLIRFDEDLEVAKTLFVKYHEDYKINKDENGYYLD